MAKRTPHGKAAAPQAFTIRPLEREDWPAIEALFGDKGACGGCWCMLWRVPRGGKAWEAAKGQPNRDAFRALVQAGKVHGMLAFSAGSPVGWCSFGPAESFPRMMRSRALARPRTATTWSITCFYILPKWRRHGLGRQLLQAAVQQAFALGASEVEGFPVVPRSAEVSIPGPFAWTGVPAMFVAAGFAETPDRSGTRPIYLKKRP
jgi:GNAT superfamily N-acetyltransferase